jgi:toxin-antitoxin system PIN domain toxin
MKSYFPDVNVWLALATRKHEHHSIAAAWFDRIERGPMYFCRFTQLAFLRLLSHTAVMGEDTKTQIEAWRAYDLLLSDERVSFHLEPEAEELELAFRKLTAKAQRSSRDWPDAYLAAFARTAGLSLVTFDRALYKLAGTDARILSAAS